MLFLICFAGLAWSPVIASSDAPPWMHALTSVNLPAHDDKTEAILLYSEEIVTVQGSGKIHRVTRKAYRILRPGGAGYGTVVDYSTSQAKLLSMHGWCIPNGGKDIEVKDKDAIEGSAPVAYGELVNDVRAKILRISQAEPGSIVGSEVEREESLFVLQDRWSFQERAPVREARYTLQLPTGWEYKAAWVNSPEIKPASTGNNQWQWVVNDIPEIHRESEMPPWSGVAGQMIVSLIPPDGTRKGFVTWPEMAQWAAGLAQGKRDPSPEIKQKVGELTADKKSTTAKMMAIADYVQSNIRYVAIELGIGGWQPHAARDIYSNQYGDCKDKATLTSAMLKEIGVDSYYLFVNTLRGAISQGTPPQNSFNHAILAIRLPDNVKEVLFQAVYADARLGRILIFDPTDDLTPLGNLRGTLQGSYGLLVTPDSGELIELPILLPQGSGVRRAGKLALSSTGALSGEVIDLRYGDYASSERNVYRHMNKKEDQVKPIETLLSHSVGTYQITKASIANLDLRDGPFEMDYSFVVPEYAKTAGQLMLVRPRVLGEKSSDILEKKEPRKYPLEFEGPRRDVDRIEIVLPAGFQVDELPPATDVEYAFGSYHSKTELQGSALVYTRTFEIKEVSVPPEKMDDLRKFYRIIANDERGTAVLKPAGY